jgi:jumonji domain-containing protein 7
MPVTSGSETKKVLRVCIWVWPQYSILIIDHYENLYCQILGSKTFHLIPPTEYSCLKGGSMTTWLISEKRFPSARWKPLENDPANLVLDPLDSTTPWLTTDPVSLNPNDPNPLLRNCRPLIITLHPGEVLYLPALWFHHVSQQPNEHGICMAVNYWYDMDFTAPLYPFFNFLRNSTMIQDNRSDEIQLETE